MNTQKNITRNQNNNNENNNAIKNSPNGGFPPIYICDVGTISKINDTANREYSSHKSSVSIKNILSKRREITPLIPI